MDGDYAPSSTESAIWPTDTKPWSWWMIPTRQVSWDPTPRHSRAFPRERRVDIITSTLGKALGGIRRLYERQKRNCRVFAATITAVPVFQFCRAANCVRVMTAIDLISKSDNLRKTSGKTPATSGSVSKKRASLLRTQATPIIPIMLGDAKIARDMARDLLDEGIYVIGFSYPVVPRARPAFDCRSQRPTQKDWTWRWKRSRRWGSDTGLSVEEIANLKSGRHPSLRPFLSSVCWNFRCRRVSATIDDFEPSFDGSITCAMIIPENG